MKPNLLIIIVITIATFASPLGGVNQAYALCMAENEINWNAISGESELIFVGTVTRLDNYGGPQKVTFFIHEAVKGEIDTPKHVLENTGMVFLGSNIVGSSSVDVDYKIGKTYKVYVENGETNRCTTKLAAPPDDYVWEPGPEDGNYYSDEEGIPLQQYQDANEIKSYRNALASGSVALLAESPKLSDRELDNVMDKLLHSELDRFVLPIASVAIDYQRDALVLWTPDLTIGNKVQAIIGDVSFVLLYEEAPARWTHDGPEPEPEPEQDRSTYESCGPGTMLENDICVVIVENESVGTDGKWGEGLFYEKYPTPSLKPVIDYDYELVYVVILAIAAILGSMVVGIIFVVRRKRR